MSALASLRGAGAGGGAEKSRSNSPPPAEGAGAGGGVEVLTTAGAGAERDDEGGPARRSTGLRDVVFAAVDASRAERGAGAEVVAVGVVAKPSPSRVSGSGNGPSMAHRLDSYFDRMNDSSLCSGGACPALR